MVKVIKPLFDNILIELTTAEEKTKNGIYLPDTVSKEKSQTGKVVAIGPGRYLEGGKKIISDLIIGDEVIFNKYAGTEIKLEDKNYLIISERDILAVI